MPNERKLDSVKNINIHVSGQTSYSGITPREKWQPMRQQIQNVQETRMDRVEVGSGTAAEGTSSYLGLLNF